MAVHAQLAEGMVRSGLGRTGVDDGEEVLDGVDLVIGDDGGSGVVEFEDAGLDLGELADGRGELRRFAAVAGGVIGVHDALAGEAGLGEGFVLGKREGGHGDRRSEAGGRESETRTRCPTSEGIG